MGRHEPPVEGVLNDLGETLQDSRGDAITCCDLEYGHQRHFCMQALAMSLFKGLILRQEPHTLRLSRVLLSVFLGRILERRAVVPSAFFLRCRVHDR